MTISTKNLRRRNFTRRLNRRRRLISETLESRRVLTGPYAPAAGNLESTAIAASDSAFVSWATQVEDYSMGTDVDAAFQTPDKSLGPAEGTIGDVVSLGRGGSITLSFDNPIRNGLGPDFAVFENSFNDTFLELAFVEVSSNGVDFVRFPNDSQTPAAVGAFGSVDPTNVDGLAGKYRQGFGTPLDLQSLVGIQGATNLDAITHVRVVDVIGDGTETDTSGDPIFDVYPTVSSAGFDLDAIGVINHVAQADVIIGFEDIGAALANESAFIGPVAGGTQAPGPHSDIGTSGTFSSEDLNFGNVRSNNGSWNGFAYSNQTDTTTPGFTNDASAFVGTGASGSATYGVAFRDIDEFYAPPTISKAAGDARTFDRLWVTNTTYAALSMLNGDSFAKQFGGVSGDDPDWFLLTITGRDTADSALGSVEFYLADYRFADNSQDYILDTWAEVDVSSLASASSLEFVVTSSDVGLFGMNTPAYFAIDNITMKQPELQLDLETSTPLESQEFVTGRVSRANDDTTSPLTVSLTIDDPDIAAVATPTVTIPTGAMHADFQITFTNDELVAPDRVFSISSTAAGHSDTTREATIREDDSPVLSLSLSEDSVSEAIGNGVVMAEITHNLAALSEPLTISLASDTPSLATIQEEVIIAAGQSSAVVPLNIIDDSLFSPARIVSITAQATDFDDASDSITVTNDDGAALSLSFASSQISETAGANVTQGTVTRNDLDLTRAVTVTLSNGAPGQVSLPQSIIIPANASSASFNLTAVDDEDFDETQQANITASAFGYSASAASLDILDNDRGMFDLVFDNATPTEGQTVTASVTRNATTLSSSLLVQLAGSIPGLATFPPSLTIPAGQETATFEIQTVDDELAQADSVISISVSAPQYDTKNGAISVVNDDNQELIVSVDRTSVSEAAAGDQVRFEDVGSQLTSESFYNGSDLAGGFESEGFLFENNHNPNFGSWSGWSFSNTTDVTTPGFLNQYSAITGGGAAGSATYAVGNTFGSTSISRAESGDGAFDSLAITNTTYATLSMLNGDFFAKKFGGVDGNDPDWFLLTIDGLDAENQPLGTVEFYLADYRFSDNTLDYIVQDWTTVDISSLADADSLSFSLSSSDVGDFGMNTPAYFAIDNLRLENTDPQPILTVSHNQDPPNSDVIVDLTSSDASELAVPAQVTIPAGQRTVSVPLVVEDDTQFDGHQLVTIDAASVSFASASTEITIEDDDSEALSLSISDASVSESDAAPMARLEDVGQTLPAESFYNGSDGAGQFVSEGITFANSYNATFGSWSGFSYSNTSDTDTPGFANQYSSVVGAGALGSATYAVASAFGSVTLNRDPSTSSGFESLEITNTTYAALSLRDGDFFAKQFGGESGNDPDWFLLTIEGLDNEGSSLGEIDFYLADFRFEDNSLDYIVDQWTTVDVSSLSESETLSFSLSSSDVGDFGMNTPAYFALDNVRLADDAPAATVTISRNSADISEPLDVSILSSDNTEALALASVTIPAGATSIAVPLIIENDALVDGDKNVVLTATSPGLLNGSDSIVVTDDDQPQLNLILDSNTTSETASRLGVRFEDVGSGLLPESFYNGSDEAGGFSSEGVSFTNDYNPQFGSWSGFSYSNTTDTTTPGFLNQYSAIAGSGADGSETYAVAAAFGSVELSRDPSNSDGFHSLEITNTTYAALSLRDGDSFAKKFGGESGDDPDWFLLSIDGRDSGGESIGTVDFYLADFRFADNSLDYVIQDWTTVDISSLADAESLSFSLSSSDVGNFGMNTPAYFALDNLRFASDQVRPTLTVRRNTKDLGLPLEVDITSSDPSTASVASTVVIPAGQSSINVPIAIGNDTIVNDTRLSTFEGTAEGFAPDSETLSVTDDDLPELSIALESFAATEGDTLTGYVRRNTADVSEAIIVDVANSSEMLASAPTTVEIPAGETGVAFDITLIDDDLVRPAEDISFTVSRQDWISDAATLSWTDNDEAALTLSFSSESVSEADAQASVRFEDVGSQLGPEAFYNGSDEAGRFISEGVAFTNNYNAQFGSWSGFSYSNTTDTTTPGFLNQFSAITGGGADDSDTYAVASAFGTVELTRDPTNSPRFESLEITNTTYAALSLRDGDDFAKQFGGESGDDPDWFLLTIVGRDSGGESIGTVDFYLADYRFADNALDYIVQDWTTVNVSPLGDAESLTFSLSSSDVGNFGMNTPAYFALDNLKFESSVPRPSLTVSRNTTADLDSELVVTLAGNHEADLNIPATVTIAAGATDVTLPIEIIDDVLVDGDKVLEITASSPAHASSSASITVADDDIALLTLTVTESSITEGSAGSVVISRNTVRSEDLTVDVSSNAADQFTVPDSVVIPSGMRAVTFPIEAIDDFLVDGNIDAELTIDAGGFEPQSAIITALDNDVAGIQVIESEGNTRVDELTLTDMISLSLTAQPTSNVTLLLTGGSGDVNLSVAQVEFTPENWNVPVAVSIDGVRDIVDEFNETVMLGVSVDPSTTDPAYSLVNPVSVAVVVEDSHDLQLVLQQTEQSLLLSEFNTAIQFASVPAAENFLLELDAQDHWIMIEPLSNDVGNVVLRAGEGNDTVVTRSAIFESLDGGEGYDVLEIDVDGISDFAAFTENRISNFEEVVFTGTTDGPIAFPIAVLSSFDAQSNPPLVRSGGEFTFVGNWQQETPIIHNGEFVQVISIDQQQVYIQSETNWQNAIDTMDVNGDGVISPIDALIPLNRLNRESDSSLPTIAVIEDFDGYFHDVNGDGQSTPLDSLLVLNYIDRDRAEAEMFSIPIPEGRANEERQELVNDLAIAELSGELSFSAPASAIASQPAQGELQQTMDAIFGSEQEPDDSVEPLQSLEELGAGASQL